MRFLPLRVGGGPDDPEAVYRVLRASVGVGGSAKADTGIDGLWRRSRALGLSCADSAIRRAIFNFFPFCCTNTLPYYERMLGLVSAPGATESERRASVTALWPAHTSARRADIETELQRIDSRFSVLSVDDSVKSSTRPGRALAPNAGSGEPEYGSTRHSSLLARSTSRAMYRVRLDTTTARRLTVTERRAIRLAKQKLRRMAPSWYGFTITTTSGFSLGTSPLGITGL